MPAAASTVTIKQEIPDTRTDIKQDGMHKLAISRVKEERDITRLSSVVEKA